MLILRDAPDTSTRASCPPYPSISSMTCPGIPRHMPLHPLFHAVPIIDQFSQHTTYGGSGSRHRVLHGGREPDSFGELGRSATHQVGRRQLATEVRECRQYRDRIHAVRVEL